MQTNDVIAVWKQPAFRAGLPSEELVDAPQHPAGRSPFESEPVKGVGGMLPSWWQTVGAVTSMMSCNLSCGETMWDGSCDFFSYGCCI